MSEPGGMYSRKTEPHTRGEEKKKISVSKFFLVFPGFSLVFLKVFSSTFPPLSPQTIFSDVKCQKSSDSTPESGSGSNPSEAHGSLKISTVETYDKKT